eukprot:6035708-Pyramimonas_sp.AAC.1
MVSPGAPIMDRGDRVLRPILVHPSMSPIRCRLEPFGQLLGRLVENLFRTRATSQHAVAGLVPQMADEAQ